jgi:hypothetical protein
MVLGIVVVVGIWVINIILGQKMTLLTTFVTKSILIKGEGLTSSLILTIQSYSN